MSFGLLTLFGNFHEWRLLLVTNVWGSLAFSPAKLERCGASRSCPNRAECLVRPVRNQQTPVIAFSLFLPRLSSFSSFCFSFPRKGEGKKKNGLYSFVYNHHFSLSPLLFNSWFFFFFYFYFVLLYFSHLAPYNHSVTDRMGLPSPPEE